MKTEYEAKFVNINITEIKQNLKKINATLVSPMRTMRRAIIDNDAMKKENAFLRVRDEGDKITLTYKRFDEDSITGAKEIEIVVDDFTSTIELLSVLGLNYRSLQESKRETWKFEDTEIVIDEWPWLKPYIEIEGKSENSVINTSKTLGLKWKDAIFGDVMSVYRLQYPNLKENDSVGNIKNVRFKDSLPDNFK